MSDIDKQLNKWFKGKHNLKDDWNYKIMADYIKTKNKSISYSEIKKLITDEEIKTYHKRLANWISDDIDVLTGSGNGNMSKAIFMHEGFKGDADNNIELKLTISAKYLITEKSREQKKDFEEEMKQRSWFIQYKMVTKEGGMMSGKSNTVSIIYADSHQEAIDCAKKHFSHSNSSIWSGIATLTLVAEYTDGDVELLSLSL